MRNLILFLCCCLSANVAFAQTCDVLAGEPTQANTIVCTDQLGDYPVAGFIDASDPGTQNPADVVTEYVQVDANGEIINIFAGPNFDLTNAMEGDVYCFHQVVYTQATINDLFDQINGFCLTLDQIQPLLDALGVEIPIPLPGDTEICVCDGIFNLELIAPLLGIELPFTCPIGGTLSDLVDALEGINAITGNTLGVDIATIENIIQNGFDINDFDPTGLIPDLPPVGADVVCADFSNTPQCVSVEVCTAECEITAVEAAAPVCVAGTGTYTVEVTVLGADASVTLEDVNSLEGSQAAAGTVIFTYNDGTASSISVVDSEAICVFPQFDQAAPDCSTACGALAPDLSNDGGDCDADPDASGDNTPFVFSEDGTGNNTAPFFTEYIVTDGAGGTIVGVFATLADAQTAANAEAATNGDACIQSINHEGLVAIVADLDVQTGGLLCTSGFITCPVNDLATLFGALAGAGAPLTVADVIALVGPPDTGVIGFDLGALIGLPPGFLVVDIPPFCYQLGNEDCVTVAPCMAVVMGCTDICAPNYDPNATQDDGNCEPYDMTCNADCTAGDFGGTWDPATCGCINEMVAVNGCTDPAADNYDAAANCDDGSCVTTAPLDITITDPCNCDLGIDFEGDGINNLAQETITISGGDGNYMITNVSGLVDNTNTALTNGPVGSTLVAFLLADGVTTYSIEVTDGAGNVAMLTGGPCDVCPEAPDDVPTVGEWGLIILALMMSITAVIGIRQRREQEVYG